MGAVTTQRSDRLTTNSISLLPASAPCSPSECVFSDMMSGLHQHPLARSSGKLHGRGVLRGRGALHGTWADWRTWPVVGSTLVSRRWFSCLGFRRLWAPPSMNGWVAPLSPHLLLLRLADANPSGAGYVHTRVGHASSSCCWWCCCQRKDISSQTSIDILLE